MRFESVLNNREEGLDQYKQQFVTDKQVDTLAEAGADVFLGLSKGNVFTPDMLLSMAKDPIVFALANPDQRSNMTWPSPPVKT